MRRFFGMYRATADDDDVAAAVVNIGQALLALGDKEGRAQVELAVNDAMTVPYARDRLEALLSSTPKNGAAPATVSTSTGTSPGTSPGPSASPPTGKNGAPPNAAPGAERMH
jgi:hypothetical protein